MCTGILKLSDRDYEAYMYATSTQQHIHVLSYLGNGLLFVWEFKYSVGAILGLPGAVVTQSLPLPQALRISALVLPHKCLLNLMVKFPPIILSWLLF